MFLCIMAEAVAAAAKAVWLEFLQAVDEPPYNTEEIEAVAGKLLEAGVRSPADFASIEERELAVVEGTLGRRAFARRAHRHYMAAQAIAKPECRSEPARTTPVIVDPDLVELMGSEASAAAVAMAISAKGELPDVQMLLKGASCEGLPYELQAENQLWTALNADTAVAIKNGRVAFAYVDLTAKQVLPVWLPADAVGGKSMPISEELWDSSRSGSSIAQLGAALRAVTQSPRCFRSIAQWSSAFWRYAPVAVAVKQMNWPMALTHHATIMRLAEELRLTEGESIIAILYDQLRRQQWAKRAAQKDPKLSLAEEMGKVDEQILLAARTRLELITKKVGHDKGFSGSSASGSQDGFPAQALAAESALAKSVSAAQTITKRAEQAAKAMASHQEELNKRQMAMRQDGKGEQHKDKGNSKGKNARQAKRKQWWSGNSGGGSGKRHR